MRVMMTLEGLTAALEGVEGWLGDAEAWGLHRSAAALPGMAPATVVEVGSWKGRSTIALAMGIGARPGKGVVIAVDPHQGSAAHNAYGEGDTFAQFEYNVQRAGVADLVEAVRDTSASARERVPDRSVDLLFVDGSHELEDVLTDIDVWTPALRPGATVAFHDSISFPGVAGALRARALVRGSAFRRPRRIQETMFFEYRPGLRWGRRDSLRALTMRAEVAGKRSVRRLKSRVQRARVSHR